MLVACQAGMKELDDFTELCNWTHPMSLSHQLNLMQELRCAYAPHGKDGEGVSATWHQHVGAGPPGLIPPSLTPILPPIANLVGRGNGDSGLEFLAFAFDGYALLGS